MRNEKARERSGDGDCEEKTTGKLTAPVKEGIAVYAVLFLFDGRSAFCDQMQRDSIR
jgi:hypothetical protein